MCQLVLAGQPLDGTREINGKANVGGLIRDANGNWIRGFGMNIGSCPISIAEIWGLYQGLNLAWNYGIRFLGAKVDSLCILHMMESRGQSPNVHTPLINSIKNLLMKDYTYPFDISVTKPTLQLIF